MEPLEVSLKKAGYEIDSAYSLGVAGNKFVIRPIKVEKQIKWNLLFWNPLSNNYLHDKNYNFTESQAELVSKAIETLMEYIQEPYHEGESASQMHLPNHQAAVKAREALEGTNG